MTSSLHDYSFSSLQDALEEQGINRQHALPLFQSLHLGREVDLPPAVLKWIEPQARVELREVRATPSGDGVTQKFLLKLEDEQEVESVLMGFSGRHTACLSSQVGCAMGCVFCATGQMGFRRHLSAGEIVSQVYFLNEKLRERGEDPVRNLVMMGMGEPLHNFDAMIEALDILTDTRGLCIGHSHITISTVGHVPGILKLAEVPRNYHLSVSLHGVSNEERGALIPVNKKWPIEDILEACRKYSEIRGQRVLIAWTLIAGVNDSDEHARRLGELLKGREIHLNLIPLNPTDGYGEQPPSEERTNRFHEIVKEVGGFPATVRQRRGIDVGAGCGQLAGSS